MENIDEIVEKVTEFLDLEGRKYKLDLCNPDIPLALKHYLLTGKDIIDDLSSIWSLWDESTRESIDIKDEPESPYWDESDKDLDLIHKMLNDPSHWIHEYSSLSSEEMESLKQYVPWKLEQRKRWESLDAKTKELIEVRYQTFAQKGIDASSKKLRDSLKVKKKEKAK